MIYQCYGFTITNNYDYEMNGLTMYIMYAMFMLYETECMHCTLYDINCLSAAYAHVFLLSCIAHPFLYSLSDFFQ